MDSFRFERGQKCLNGFAERKCCIKVLTHCNNNNKSRCVVKPPTICVSFRSDCGGLNLQNLQVNRQRKKRRKAD